MCRGHIFGPDGLNVADGERMDGVMADGRPIMDIGLRLPVAATGQSQQVTRCVPYTLKHSPFSSLGDRALMCAGREILLVGGGCAEYLTP